MLEHDALFPRAVPLGSPAFEVQRDIAHGILSDIETRRFDEYVDLSHLDIVDRYTILAEQEPKRKDLVMLAHAALDAMNRELLNAGEQDMLTA